MSKNNSYSSMAEEREDLEKTVAFARELTRDFDNMTARLATGNAELVALTEELRLDYQSPMQ